MNGNGRCKHGRGYRAAGQLTGTVFFFFFFGEEVFFRAGVVCAGFCPIDAGGAVCAGRVVVPGEPGGGDVTAGVPAGAEVAVVCGRVTSGVATAGSAAGI